ncbi:MAG: nitrous oxide reductase accessory protein NosL [Paracoccaceae bacterium]|nr:nitrous oxide reductase accessory protein NosL [Paracoccaceae bacterium]
MKRIILASFLVLAACREDVAAVIPAPVEMTQDALGHYCQMIIAEHAGPKAQIHLKGTPEPIFFGQVRDALAYLKEPERTAPVLVVYVSDMSNAKSWTEPGEANWIDAQSAFFVVDSDARGGMGAPEVVPFGQEADAIVFAQEHGGAVARLDEIPEDAVLGAYDVQPSQPEGEGNP